MQETQRQPSLFIERHIGNFSLILHGQHLRLLIQYDIPMYKSIIDVAFPSYFLLTMWVHELDINPECESHSKFHRLLHLENEQLFSQRIVLNCQPSKSTRTYRAKKMERDDRIQIRHGYRRHGLIK